MTAEEQTHYRALFVGGPIDGHEKYLREPLPEIDIMVPKPFEVDFTAPLEQDPPMQRPDIVRYNMVISSRLAVFVYSVVDPHETLLRLWGGYSNGTRKAQP
jgi:hypothetical protein